MSVEYHKNQLARIAANSDSPTQAEGRMNVYLAEVARSGIGAQAIEQLNAHATSLWKDWNAPEIQTAQAKREYQARFSQYEPEFQKQIDYLNDPSNIQAVMNKAKERARGSLAAEYAARGISGTGAYDEALASAMQDLTLKEDSMIMERQAQARQLMDYMIQAKRADFTNAQGYEQAMRQLNQQQSQFDIAQKSAAEQADAARKSAYWQMAGQLAGTATGAAIGGFPGSQAGGQLGSSTGAAMGAAVYGAPPNASAQSYAAATPYAPPTQSVQQSYPYPGTYSSGINFQPRRSW